MLSKKITLILKDWDFIWLFEKLTEQRRNRERGTDTKSARSAARSPDGSSSAGDRRCELGAQAGSLWLIRRQGLH